MWGGITSNRWTQLVIVAGNLTSIRHRDKIIRPHVLFLQGQRGAVMLQQDNARPHVARVVTDFLRQQNVNTLPWPAVSPDLSPIEHLWDEMERRLPNLPLTLNQLGHDLEHPTRVSEPSGVIKETSLSGLCARTRWTRTGLTL